MISFFFNCIKRPCWDRDKDLQDCSTNSELLQNVLEQSIACHI